MTQEEAMDSEKHAGLRQCCRRTFQNYVAVRKVEGRMMLALSRRRHIAGTIMRTAR